MGILGEREGGRQKGGRGGGERQRGTEREVGGGGERERERESWTAMLNI